MNKRIRLLVLAFTIALLFQAGLTAQENDTAKTEIIINQMRLPFPVSKDKKAKYYSLDDEVAIRIIQAKQELGLYDLVVGIYFDSTAAVPDSVSANFKVLNFDEITSANQSAVIISTEISQQGVPPDHDAAYFSLDKDISTKQSSDYSKNIQTRLLVYAQIVDIRTGTSLGALDLEVFHTGSSAKKSKAKAMKLLKEKAKEELKRSYWFSAEVITTEEGIQGIPYGTKSQIGKGMIFELVEPDRIWELEGEEFLVPGSSAAIAAVADTSADSSGLRILRQWRDHYPGAWAVEHPEPLFGLGLHFYLPITDSYLNLGGSFHVRPTHTLDCGLDMQLIRVTDSYGDDDYGFGFGGFGIWRFINTSKIDVGGKLGVDLEIPYRKDDNGETVYTALFSAQVGIVAELLFARKYDFVIHAGYHFAVKADYWEYSEEEETIPAYWENKAPEVDNSGLIFSVGLKYFLF